MVEKLGTIHLEGVQLGRKYLKQTRRCGSAQDVMSFWAKTNTKCIERMRKCTIYSLPFPQNGSTHMTNIRVIPCHICRTAEYAKEMQDS